MHNIITVALHEFFETIRTRAFFFSVFVVPALVAVFVFGAGRIVKLTETQATPVRRLAVVDHTGMLSAALAERVAEYNKDNSQRPFAIENEGVGADPQDLAAQVRSGELYAYIVLPADILAPGPESVCELARKDQQFHAGRDLEAIINDAVQRTRLRAAGLDPSELARLQTVVPLRKLDVRTGEVGRDDELVRMMTPFGFMLLLFMGTMQISYGLLTSLLEEKSSRVIEVLLSTVKPTELMAGKIIGVVMTGILLLAIWGGVGWHVADSGGHGNLITWRLLAYVTLYFVPGFLLLSAILGAIGSACNTLKEAQSMASPLSLVTMVPLMLWMPISQNPNAPFALVLSYIPPISPFVMVLRVCSDLDIPAWQLVTTQLALWGAIIVTIWAAGKIFRVGVLMYGKPPSLRELLRWMRYA